MVTFDYTEEIGGKTMKENQLTEYKEQKGIFQWLKFKFEKLKEIFSSKNKLEIEQEKQDWSKYELTEEELEDVKGGIPIPTKVVDEEELMADLGIKEPKSWELTEEELDEVKAGTPEPTTVIDEGELTEDELDEVKGGQPIIDEER